MHILYEGKLKSRLFLCLLLLLAVFIGSCGKKNTVTSPTAPAVTVFAGTATVTYTVPSSTVTPSFSPTPTVTPSMTQFIASKTVTGTHTQTATPSITETDTIALYSRTVTQTSTVTDTDTVTQSPTYTMTATPTETMTLSQTKSETPSVTQTITLTPLISATVTPTFGGNRGSLNMSPSSFVSGDTGMSVTFTYTAGELGWIGPDPLYGTLKITIPSDWSPPSLTLTDPGYFSVTLPSGGSLVGLGVNGREIVIWAADVPSLTGKIVVVYGDKTLGGAGATIGASGTVTIASQAAEAGDTTHPLNSDPQAVIIPPTQTVTPTFTPVIGEGTVTVLPLNVTDGSSGNTLLFTYTAGKTNWSSSAEGGTIKITLPSGWSPPSVEDTFPGCFYAFASAGAEVVSLQEQGMSMLIRVRNLPAFTGTITIVYGYKGKGGPGAYISGTGTYELLCETDVLGANVYPIASSPVINVLAPTSTVTGTPSITPTSTGTPTITETHTITPTHTDTGTDTITPTITETATVTETATGTITVTATPTSTVTSTITPSWELIGTQGLSAGRAYYTSIAVDNGVPYIVYADGSQNSRVIVKKFVSGAWQNLGTNPVSDGIAYDTKIAVYGGIVHIAYRDYFNGNIIKVKRYAGAVWQELNANSTAASSGPANELSFTIDADGAPWVAFRDEDNGGKLAVRKYDITNGWEDMGSALTTGIASDISIKVYNGEAFVAFRDWDMNYRARVIKRDAVWSTWAQYGTAPLTLADATYIKLFIQPDGTMFAAFTETNNYNRVSVMKYSAGAWSYFGGLPNFSSDNCGYVSLTSYLGVPYTAYRDGGKGNSLTVARNKTGWGIVGYNISLQQAEYVSMVFDTVNQMPYVVFADENKGYKATVMRYTGSF